MLNVPKSAIKAYKLWLAVFPECMDVDAFNRFYIFIHILLANSKKERSRFWLEERLKADCKNKLRKKDIEMYCEIYQHLKVYENVKKSPEGELRARILIDEAREEARKKYS
jgi:hypothetical protein